jgi:tetratricopeptide (TPR) repeat protein
VSGEPLFAGPIYAEDVMPRPRLFLSHDTDYDFLTALELGRVDDGQPPDHWLEISESFHFLLDAPEGGAVGFRVDDFRSFDPGPEEIAAIRSGRRFDVPLLMLRNADAVRIAEAAERFFRGRNSVNRDFFDRATACGARRELEQELFWWRCCLQSGDQMAHFGIGYTLCDLARWGEALPHLEHYVRIAPHGPWNWVWLGKCLAALGRVREAVVVFERAINLTDAGEDETDAPELLAALDG